MGEELSNADTTSPRQQSVGLQCNEILGHRKTDMYVLETDDMLYECI